MIRSIIHRLLTGVGFAIKVRVAGKDFRAGWKPALAFEAGWKPALPSALPSFVAGSILLNSVFNLPSAQSWDGVHTYEVEGTHSLFGNYHGMIEFRDTDKSVQRDIRFDDYKFDGLKVRELWSGTFQQHGSDKLFDVQFKLKQADIFNRVDGDVRTRTQFAAPYSVSYSLDLSKPQSLNIINPSGTYSEKIGKEFQRPSPLPATPPPIWVNERKNIPAMGDKMGAIGDLSMITLFYPIMCVLRADPFYKSFENREEFKTHTQYCVLDPTDFNFLRQNEGTLSLANKVTDRIALTEAALKASAYGTPLLKKAEIFGKDMKENHINQFGLFSGAVFDADDKFVDYTANGDGALWSGMYAGSEAMRWLVTKDPDALLNFKRTTSGLMLLMDVTGDENEFGRTAHPIKAGETISGPWAQGAGKYQNIKYIKIGNNDMIKGLFHAFIWAYEILPADDPFLAEVSEHARRLPKLRISQEKVHPGNALSATGLAAIASGQMEDLYKYLAVYELVMQPVGLLKLDEGFYAGGIGDWSGVNLMMVSNVSQILVAKHVARKFRDVAPHFFRPFLDEAVGHQRQKLAETWATYAHVRRDFMTIAADAFAVGKSPLVEFPKGTTPTQWQRKEEWDSLRPLSVWSLRELPVPIGKHLLNYDYSWRPDWCLSYWPHLPWKYLVERKTIDFYYLSAYNYPLFEGTSLDSDNVWTSAFDYRGAANPNYRNGRIDFLHVYWMGRLSGLLDEKS